MDNKHYIILYTDGSCYKGYGGWGYLVQEMNGRAVMREAEGSGCNTETTVNQMEMTAVMEGLTWLLEHNNNLETYVVSDSMYIVGAIRDGWLLNWKRNNEMLIGVKNREFWKMMSDLLDSIDFPVRFVHTRGHKRGMEFHIEGNERVDKLASYKKHFPNLDINRLIKDWKRKARTSRHR